jgi:putative SOS response-associated peptidase YedK
MCGRFTLTWEEWRRVAEPLRIDDDGDVAASYRPRFNIAPTDQHFIVTSEFERRRVQRAHWGLVNRRATENRRASQCINAKAETLEQRATFLRPSSSAAVSFRPTASTNGPAPRASANRYGFTRATAT